MITYSKKEIVVGFIVIVVVIIFVAWLKPNNKELLCDRFIDIYNKKIEGVIVDKYIDRDNHNYPILAYVDKSGEQYYLNLSLDVGEVFSNAAIGNLLSKKSKTDTITVNGIDYKLSYGVNCWD